MTFIFENIWLDLLVLLGIIACILILYKFIVYLINRAAKSGKIPPDVVNGIRLVVRLVVAITIIALIVAFTELPPEITIAISAITGTIIGFASIQAIQNFISGIYIIITRPFGINDLVAIGNLQGIVSEISLNYTKLITSTGKKILISNRNVLNSDLVNFTIASTQKSQDDDSKFKIFKDIFISKEVNRYAFNLELTRENPEKVKKALEEAAIAWTPEFKYKPQYLLWNLTYFAVYRFIITADDPETIIKKKPLFIKDIYRRIYSHDQKVV